MIDKKAQVKPVAEPQAPHADPLVPYEITQKKKRNTPYKDSVTEQEKYYADVDITKLMKMRAILASKLETAKENVKSLNANRDACDKYIKAHLEQTGDYEVSIPRYKAFLDDDEWPEVVDWDALYKFVQDTGHFGLFYRKIIAHYYKDLLDSDIKVPGLRIKSIKKVSFRRTKK